MITDLGELQEECLQELEDGGYSTRFIKYLVNRWTELGEWMKANGHEFITREVAKLYCEETFGSFVLPLNPTVSQRMRLRAIRMLVSYQETQSFEARSHRADHSLNGSLASEGEAFLRHLESIGRAAGTITHKRWRIRLFLNFLNELKILPEKLGLADIDAFLMTAAVQKAGVSACNTDLREFLSFLFERGVISKNISLMVPKITRAAPTKLPTTYTQEEIQAILDVVEKSSAIGRRDHLILLLACEYGLRSSDIAGLEFSDFDWDNNTITHRMQKTGEVIELPLLSDVGNALIAYAENGRPDTDAPQVVVMHRIPGKGKPLTYAAIHTIVSGYIEKAGIKDWQKRKHGPHALRFSLATRLQKEKVAIPVISQVLGHRSTQTTSNYIKIDTGMLGNCPLPMPPLRSKIYTPEGRHGKL